MPNRMTAEEIVIDAAKKAHDKGSNDFSDVYKGIVQLQQEDRGDSHKFQADMTRVSSRLHAIGVLPGVDLTGVDTANHLTGVKNGSKVDLVASDVRDVFVPRATSHSWLESVENVAGALGKGAWNEITHHYGRVAFSGAVGFGVGAAATLLAPEIVAAAGIAGLGIAGYQLVTHVPKWLHDAKVVANPSSYSPTEARKAELTIENLGGGAVDLTDRATGGYAGSKFANSQLFASIKDAVMKQPAAVAAAAPETSAPAVVAAPESAAPAVAPESVAIKPAAPAVPENFQVPKLKLLTDQDSFQASIPGDPKAWVRAEVPSPGNIEITDIYRGDLPAGRGGDLLAKALGDHNILPTRSLTFKSIINVRNLEQFEAGMAPAETVLGQTGTRALEILKLKPVNYSFVWAEDKLNLVIETIK